MTSTKAWGESCAKPTLCKATMPHSQDMLITQDPIPSNVSSLNCWPMLLGRECRGKRDSAECSALPAKDFLTRADTVKHSAKRNWNVPAQLLSLTQKQSHTNIQSGCNWRDTPAPYIHGSVCYWQFCMCRKAPSPRCRSVWSAKLTLAFSTGLELGRRGGGTNTQGTGACQQLVLDGYWPSDDKAC